MTPRAAQGSGLVPVQYHQFIVSDEDGPLAPDLPANRTGLINVQDGEAYILTGIHTGDVEVTVTLHDTPPDLDNGGGWQEIAEISAHSASGELLVRGMMSDLDEELPTLSFNGPGDYRLRVHARGRDTAIDLAPDDVTEWYLIQSWPAPPDDVKVLRQSDGYGASVRSR